MIGDTLKNSKIAIRFRAMVATPRVVGGILNDGCQMIHYAGHGEGESLSFETDDERQCGIMKAFEVNSLKNLVQSKHPRTQLVFLGSCCSELSGNAFVSAGVPHVVAIKTGENVTDKVARSFSQEFYKAIFGHTLQTAFNIASRIACNNAGNPEQPGGPFVLLPSDGNHDVHIFDRRPGKFIDETQPLPDVCPHLPRARDPYLGEHVLQKVVAALVDPFAACVTVVGERGSGKTETAIHACKYVRERRRFDAIFFAKWDKPSWGWQTSGDLCSLVGEALGVNPAPSSIEQLADFLSKNVEEGRTVLLVLDGVGALVEEGDQEAQDELLQFLCSLSERKDSYKLKLLVTSNAKLQHWSSACFRSGSEQVFKIPPLEGTDPAQLVFNTASRKLKRRELGVHLDYSHDDLLAAMLRHLGGARGHPGTLVRLASSVDDNDLLLSSFGEAAVRIWEEYHPTLTSPSSSPTFNGHGSFFDSDIVSGGAGNRGRDGEGVGSPRSPTDNRRGEPHQSLRRELRLRRIGQQELRGGVPHQQLRRETRQRRLRPRPLERSNEYVDPQMYLQQHPQDTASETELRGLGCYAVWQGAIGITQADGRTYGERPLAGDTVCGRTNRAPLKCVSDTLRRHLCRRHCFSNSHCRIRKNYPQYEFHDDGRVELEESESDDAVDRPTSCGISDEEMRFVEERLQDEQRKLACGGRGRHDVDAQDTISIEGFVQFCKWWAAAMATVWQLRDDRWSTAVGMRWFVGRQAAYDMLSEKESGTFLLRFSETRPGALVISLKKNVPSTQASRGSVPPSLVLGVVSLRVEVDGGGRCRFVHEREDTDPSGVAVYRTQHVGYFSSLTDLIVRNENMQTLCPNIPKEEALQ